jgi:L-alanine-DL-glutamate epimerase-like enolase superfamily enzyme
MLSAVRHRPLDILGTRAGLPLRHLLGGLRDNVAAVQAAATTGPATPCDNVAAGAHAYHELGFTAFKLKFGGLPFRTTWSSVKRGGHTEWMRHEHPTRPSRWCMRRSARVVRARGDVDDP